MPRVYKTAARSWRGSTIAIHDATTGDIFATVPLNFVQDSGVNTWEYVLDLVNMLVDPVPDCSGLITTTSGDEVDLASAPSAGDYVFKQSGSDSPLTFSRGPEYTSAYRPASTGSRGSADSQTPTPSSYQTHFRTELRARDFDCLITGMEAKDCEAVHIVPKCRPDVYRQVLEIPTLQDPPLYDVSSGLLISMVLHNRYDSLEWSLYCKDNLYYVHFFTRSALSVHHGQVIRPDRFRVHSPDDLPDPKLLAWHYAQCARARIRGFAAGMPSLQNISE